MQCDLLWGSGIGLSGTSLLSTPLCACRSRRVVKQDLLPIRDIAGIIYIMLVVLIILYINQFEQTYCTWNAEPGMSSFQDLHSQHHVFHITQML